MVVCALVTAANDYQKEKQFTKLLKIADKLKEVTVVRNGIPLALQVADLVVGDIVVLVEGMDLPADGYLIQGIDITCDESSMTGETEPIKKAPLDQCIIRKQQIEEEGGRNSTGIHDIPSPILMSSTKVIKLVLICRTAIL